MSRRRAPTIDPFVPRGEGEIAQALAANGEGLYAVVLATPDLAASRQYLTAAGIATSAVTERPPYLRTDDARTSLHLSGRT
jgi:hypothetical protein